MIVINLFNLSAKIALDDKGFNSGVDKSERGFTRFGKKVTGVIAALGIGKLAKDTIKLGIDTNAMSETAGVAWTTLLGSQEKSKKMLDDIAKFAATTPFSKMGVNDMAIQLNNAGLKGNDLFNQLTKFGDMAGAFGIQSASLEEMVRQYAQVKQAGVAYTEDLNILQDRGIPIYKAIAKELGINESAVRKWASEGKISAETYQKALDGIAETTKGGMKAQSETFSGMLSTFKDTWGEIAAILAKPIFDKIKDAMIEIGPKLETFSETLKDEGLIAALDTISPDLADMAQSIKDVFNYINENKDTIGGLVAGIMGAIVALNLYKAAATLVTVAQMIMNGVFLINPYAAIAAAIGAIVGTLVYLWVTSEDFRNYWTDLWEKLKEKVVAIWNGLSRFFTETIPTIISNISTWFSELPGKIKAWFDKTVEKAKNWLTQMKQKAQETAQGFVSKAIEFIQQLPSKIWNFLKQCIDKATQWASQMKDKAKEAAKNMVDKVVDGIKELPNKVMETGKNIVKGLWNGISGMGGWLYGKVKGFATGILDNMKSALGIHSPSREAKKQVGQWIPPGITEGFEDQLPKMDRQIKGGMADMIKSAANFDLSPINNNLNLASAVDIGSINPKGVKPLSTPQTTQTFNNTFTFNIEGDLPFDKVQQFAEQIEEAITYNIQKRNIGIGSI